MGMGAVPAEGGAARGLPSSESDRQLWEGLVVCCSCCICSCCSLCICSDLRRRMSPDLSRLQSRHCH